MGQQELHITEEKKRNITINLSDMDVYKLSVKAGEVNITVEELIEGYVMDLIGGRKAHGSDEHEFALRYFERSWYDNGTLENTYLSYLIKYGDIDMYLAKMGTEEILEREIQYYKNLPVLSTEDKEELEYSQNTLKAIQDVFKEEYEDYCKSCIETQPEPFEEARNRIVEWQKAYRRLLTENVPERTRQHKCKL